MDPKLRSYRPPHLVIDPPKEMDYEIVSEDNSLTLSTVSDAESGSLSYLVEACIQGDLEIVQKCLDEGEGQDLRSLFVYDAKDEINLIHIAALMRNANLAQRLLNYLYRRDSLFAKEMLLAKYSGCRSPLYISLVGDIKVDIVILLLEWADKLNVFPEEIADTVLFQHLYNALCRLSVDESASMGNAMLLRVMACQERLAYREIKAKWAIDIDGLFDELYKANLSDAEVERLKVLQEYLKVINDPNFFKLNPRQTGDVV